MAHPKRKGKPKWSHELAYAVGLIVADGCLSSNRRHIEFCSKDRCLVETFQRCLDLEQVKVGTKTSGTSTRRYYRIQFGDVTLYHWLESIGITARKSLTIANVAVPNEYFFDFVRGLWDGDGTIYAVRDKRWANAMLVSLGFASGSMLFLVWLKGELNERLGVQGFVSRGKQVMQLRYGRADSKKIIDALFYQDDLPHLGRKFAKAQKIFRMCGL